MTHLSRSGLLRLMAAAPLALGLTAPTVRPASAAPGSGGEGDAERAVAEARRAGGADPLAHLRRCVAGPVLSPTDDGYAQEAAGFEVAHTPAPRLVVGATRAEDVRAAVLYALAVGAKVRVQATGHGLEDDLRDTVLVTTRRLGGVSVDPKTRTATIGAGVRWREVLDAAAAHGLAPLLGSSSAVGAVGYSLGGGTGLLSRQHGWAADALRSLDVVTGDARLRTVDAKRDGELHWALRGGKFGLGVVTRAVVDLVPVTRLRGGSVFFAASDAAAVLHAWRRWAPTLPREAATSVALLTLPPSPQLPPPLSGQQVVAVRFSHTGDPARADALVAPVRTWAPVLVDGVQELPFTASDAVHSDPTDPAPTVNGGTGLRELPAAAVDALLAAAGPGSGSPLVAVELRLMGGALSEAPKVPDAVVGRGAAYSLWGLGIVAGPAAGQAKPALDRMVASVGRWACPGPLNLAGGGWRDDLRTPEQRKRLEKARRRFDPARVIG